MDDLDANNFELDAGPELEAARPELSKAQSTLRRREAELGVDGRKKLTSKTKRRLRALLRPHKFEREALERSPRRQQGSGDFRTFRDRHSLILCIFYTVIHGLIPSKLFNAAVERSSD